MRKANYKKVVFFRVEPQLYEFLQEYCQSNGTTIRYIMTEAMIDLYQQVVKKEYKSKPVKK